MEVKIENKKVTLLLDDFTDLMSTVESAIETKEANKWLRNTRANLVFEVASLEAQLCQKPVPKFKVYKLQDGILFTQQIKESWPVGDNTYEIVIHGD